MERVAVQMGIAPSTATKAPSVALGRFTVAPQQPLIQMPVVALTLTAMERVNRTVATSSKDQASESTLPIWRTTTAADRMYQLAPTRSGFGREILSDVPVDYWFTSQKSLVLFGLFH